MTITILAIQGVLLAITATALLHAAAAGLPRPADSQARGFRS